MLHAPGMEVVHRGRQLRRELPTAEVDVQKRASETPLSGKRRNLMDVPAGSGEIRQTQMTKGVRRETNDSRDARDMGDRFRPRPNAERAPGISIRDGQEERTTNPADRSSLVQV